MAQGYGAGNPYFFQQSGTLQPQVYFDQWGNPIDQNTAGAIHQNAHYYPNLQPMMLMQPQPTMPPQGMLGVYSVMPGVVPQPFALPFPHQHLMVQQPLHLSRQTLPFTQPQQKQQSYESMAQSPQPLAQQVSSTKHPSDSPEPKPLQLQIIPVYPPSQASDLKSTISIERKSIPEFQPKDEPKDEQLTHSDEKQSTHEVPRTPLLPRPALLPTPARAEASNDLKEGCRVNEIEDQVDQRCRHVDGSDHNQQKRKRWENVTDDGVRGLQQKFGYKLVEVTDSLSVDDSLFVQKVKTFIIRRRKLSDENLIRLTKLVKKKPLHPDLFRMIVYSKMKQLSGLIEQCVNEMEKFKDEFMALFNNKLCKREILDSFICSQPWKLIVQGFSEYYCINNEFEKAKDIIFDYFNNTRGKLAQNGEIVLPCENMYICQSLVSVLYKKGGEEETIKNLMRTLKNWAEKTNCSSRVLTEKNKIYFGALSSQVHQLKLNKDGSSEREEELIIYAEIQRVFDKDIWNATENFYIKNWSDFKLGYARTLCESGNYSLGLQYFDEVCEFVICLSQCRPFIEEGMIAWLKRRYFVDQLNVAQRYYAHAMHVKGKDLYSYHLYMGKAVRYIENVYQSVGGGKGEDNCYGLTNHNVTNQSFVAIKSEQLPMDKQGELSKFEDIPYFNPDKFFWGFK